MLLLILLLAAGAARPQSRPTPATDTRPRGSAEILRKALADYADARAKNTKESLARAAEIDASLAGPAWEKIDVPAITFEFAVAEEQRLRDKKNERWDFERLPPAIVRMVPTEHWAAFVETRLDALTQKSGTISWKSPKAWRNVSSDMVQSRAFEKIASHLSTALAKSLATVPAKDLDRIRAAFLKIYETYDVDTVHKSTQYEYLPAGFYLQWGGWLGDLRAWKIANTIVLAWRLAPKASQEPNLDQAVRAIGLFNNQLDPKMEPERAELVRKLKADPMIPEWVKANMP